MMTAPRRANIAATVLLPLPIPPVIAYRRSVFSVMRPPKIGRVNSPTQAPRGAPAAPGTTGRAPPGPAPGGAGTPAQRWMNQIPLRRGGTVEDVANCALYLASDLSSYVSGQVIQVDGGMNT